MSKSEEIIKELEDVSPFLLTVPRVNVFTVPEDYFTYLALNTIKKITGKADACPVQLKDKQKTNPFNVPEGYFDELAGNMLNRVKEEPQGKVVSMRSKMWTYAAAAVIAMILLLGAFLMFENSTSETSLYSSSVEKYSNYRDLAEGIASLTNEEIAAYLETNGNIMDNERLLNGVDDSALPSPFDYLANEDALNEYLNKIGF